MSALSAKAQPAPAGGAAPSAVETWKIMIGWSSSSAAVISRLNASGSEPRGWLIAWYFGAT